MNPTFKQVTKTRYVELVAELAQEIFVQHYTKLTPKVAAALADKYQSDILTDDEIHSGVINYFLIYLGTEPGGLFCAGPGACGRNVFKPPVLEGKGARPGHWPQHRGLRPKAGRGRRPQPPVYESLGPRPEGRGLCKKVPLPQGRDRPHGGFARHHAGYHHLGKAVAVKRRGVGGRRPPANGRLPGRGRARPAPNIPASTQYPQSRTANAKFGDIS